MQGISHSREKVCSRLRDAALAVCDADFAVPRRSPERERLARQLWRYFEPALAAGDIELAALVAFVTVERFTMRRPEGAAAALSYLSLLQPAKEAGLDGLATIIASNVCRRFAMDAAEREEMRQELWQQFQQAVKDNDLDFLPLLSRQVRKCFPWGSREWRAAGVELFALDEREKPFHFWVDGVIREHQRRRYEAL